MSMTMARTRADAESRQNEEKRVVERKKNCIVLCARWMMDHGYLESVRQIERETNLSLDRVDVADNVDLATILTEYEDFYEMRFGRKPKLTRKVAGDDEPAKGSKKRESSVSLPKLPAGIAEPSISPRRGDRADRPKREAGQRARSEGPRRERPPSMPEDDGAKKDAKDAGKEDGDKGLGLGLEGQNVAKVAAAVVAKKESKLDQYSLPAGEDYYSNLLLKAAPGANVDKEYRELANTIQRDILTRNPGISWDSIVGLGNAKQLMKEAVVMPLKYPQFFTGLLAPWKGVLLFGPPGTGKTLLAKAVATECETTFFNISASTVVSKWRGDSEKLIRVLFDLARHHQPSTIFIDELDSIISARGGDGGGEHEGSRRMKTELLIQMDGLARENDMVFLLAASNLPWDLDSAMLRRLEKRILVNLPNAAAREAMIKANLPEGFAEGLDYAKLAGHAEGWSGSDIRLLCKEAAMHPLRRLMTEIERVETAEQAVAAHAAKSNRKRAAEKVAEKAGGGHPSAIDDLKVGAVLEADVERALQTVHRAPSAHLDKYQAWQDQFGAA